MIRRRKRPHARTQFEKQLRSGPRTWLHEPKPMAARDFILHGQNLNPFRPGTMEHEEYDRSYAQTVEDLTACRHLNTPTKDTHNRVGKPTSSRRRTE